MKIPSRRNIAPTALDDCVLSAPHAPHAAVTSSHRAAFGGGGSGQRSVESPAATIHVRDENSSERMIYHQWSAIAILIYDINSEVVWPPAC